MHRAPLAAAAVVAALLGLAPGCGGDGGPTKAEFIGRADPICREAKDDIAALGEPQDMPALDRYGRSSAAIVRRMIGRLSELEVPEGDEEAVAAVFEELATFEQLGLDLSRAAVAEDAARLAGIEARSKELTQRGDAVGRAYGFEVCGIQERDVEGGRLLEGPDQDLAEAITLAAADFPPGWTEQPAPADDGDDALADCVALDELDAATSGKATGKRFTKPPGSTVGSIVFVMNDARAADTAYATLTGAPVLECLTDVIREGLAGESGRASDLNLAPAPMRVTADESSTQEGFVSVETAAGRAGFGIDFTFARRDRVVGFVYFINATSALPAAQRQPLVAKLAARMVPPA